METIAEKECSALGGLFQLIVNDLKMGSPVWEDFLGKATKLHSHLKTTVFALTAFLDAFQKIADLATGTRGATKDIGTALTRLCLRHRSVETKLKTFSSTIMDHLVIPLQERLEEWKKIAYQMDKDHAKEYKRVRQDIKKKSSDTLRLQKKVRKSGKGDTKKTLDTAIQDVNDKYHLLEETEKHAVRRALIEERSRYCLFVSCLRPVVESELATLHEVSHLQEVLDALAKLTEDPHMLPSASEQVIADVKSTDSTWSFQTPPSSPTSLGSRKSSVCSISSLNSSSGDSSKSYSPSHHRSRSLSQHLPPGALRLLSVSSQDSGFTSQDTLFSRIPTPPPLEVTNKASDFVASSHMSGDGTGCSGPSSPPFPPPPSVTATWPNLQDTDQFERAGTSITKSQRPHTISSAYERHVRPPLTVQTFQPLEADVQEQNAMADSSGTLISATGSDGEEYSEEITPTHKPSTPPLPPRCDDLNRAQPKVPQKPVILRQRCQHAIPEAAVCISAYQKEPIYANASDGVRSTCKQIVLRTESGTTGNNKDRASFHEDLVAAVAQKAKQKQMRTLPSVNNNSFEGDVKVTPPVPPKTTHTFERKSLSLQSHPPLVPPHKTPVDSAVKKPSASSEKETTWNVFTDTVDSSDAHAQLMQALNARLNILQQQAEDLDNPTPVENRRFSVIVTSGQTLENQEIHSHTLKSSVTHRRSMTAHPQRKPRAHSIGGTERDAFLNTLNSKFNQMQQEQSSLQTSPKQHEKLSLVTSSAIQDAHHKGFIPRDNKTKLNQDKRTCFPNYESSYTVAPTATPTEFCSSANVISNQYSRQDRRHSLNFPDCGSNRFQTFFSPSASSNIEAEHAQLQQGTLLDTGCGMMTDAAARVQTWLAGRGSMDMKQCRTSLLGQIRQGKNLRKVQTNDRSAPFF